MPEQILNILYKKIQKEWIIAFCMTFLSGLIVHFYKFTNFLPNWDSLMDYYYPINNMTHQGRHFQVLSTVFSGFSDVPWVIGLLCLVYLSLTVVLITDLFLIKKTFFIALTAAIFTTFPTITSCFAFMYMADAFFMSLFLAVLSVYLSLHKKWGFLPAALLLSISMGTYQAYIAFAITLILLWILCQLLFTDKTFKNLIPPCGKLLAMGGISSILYVVSLQILSALENIPLSGHQGMGNMSLPSLSRIVSAFYESYVDTVYFFVGSLSNLNLFGICNIIILLSSFSLLIHYIISKKLYQKPVSLIAIVVCLLLLPAVSHIFYFLTPDVNYHLLMQASLVLIYVFAILLYMHVKLPWKAVYWGIFSGIIILAYSNAVTANTNYTALTRSYQKSYALMNRIVDRMEQLENFEQAEYIAILGELPDSDKIALDSHPQIVGYTDKYFFSHQAHIVAMLDDYYNISLKSTDNHTLKILLENDAILQMKAWPDKQSVIQLNDIIIIKLGDFFND